MSDAVKLDVEAGVASVILNRPEALNALNGDLLAGLRQALTRIENRDDVRAVLISGAGGNFMAGGDIKMFHSAMDAPGAERAKAFGEVIDDVHEVIRRLTALPVPVVAGVHGAVAGFGVSLLAACDLAVAAEDAVFTLAYCHIGTSPDGGATWHLPRLLGLRRAMEVALLGERFPAAQAERIGLINRAVAPQDLEAAAYKLALRLAQGPTQALGRTKKLLRDGLDTPLGAHLDREADAFVASTATGDFAEGVRAFIDKRPPHFIGR